MYRVEFHTKRYGKTKSKDLSKNGKGIGLETRLILKPKIGAWEIINFDYQFQATRYLKERFGDLRDGEYMIESNYLIYGKRGYRW